MTTETSAVTKEKNAISTAVSARASAPTRRKDASTAARATKAIRPARERPSRMITREATFAPTMPSTCEGSMISEICSAVRPKRYWNSRNVVYHMLARGMTSVATSSSMLRRRRSGPKLSDGFFIARCTSARAMMLAAARAARIRVSVDRSPSLLIALNSCVMKTRATPARMGVIISPASRFPDSRGMRRTVVTRATTAAMSHSSTT